MVPSAGHVVPISDIHDEGGIMRRSLFFTAVLLFAMTLVPVASAQVIGINANKYHKGVALRQGFVHGITYQNGDDVTTAIHLVSALKPGSWRSSYYSVYQFVADAAQLPQTLGTKITFVIQDVFNQKYGFGIEVTSSCALGVTSCFLTYDALKTAWLGVVDQIMQTVNQNNLIIDYYDVFGEPTSGATKLSGLTPDQLMDLFRVTSERVRQYRPDAKVSGPDLATYNASAFKTFLTYVAANGLRLDALSWHEFGTPDVLVAHVQEMRDYMKTVPGLICDPTCPQIHINEYESGMETFIPGSGVAWIYYLEKAGVDVANRACYDLQGSGLAWSTCWAGFDGMLLSDNKTPQPLYWVYRAYAALDATRLYSQSSDKGVVALASRNDATKEIQILAGKYSLGEVDGKVTIYVQKYPYGGSNASVEVIAIPSSGNTPVALASLPPATTTAVPIQNGTLTITINNFRVGDAYSIVVKPL